MGKMLVYLFAASFVGTLAYEAKTHAEQELKRREMKKFRKRLMKRLKEST